MKRVADQLQLQEELDLYGLMSVKKMYMPGQLNGMQMPLAVNASSGGSGSTVSSTTPSSMCSTPVQLQQLQQQQLLSLLGQPAYSTAASVGQMAGMQIPVSTHMLEGIPFFFVNNQQSISISALQRVAESKSGMVGSAAQEPKIDTSKHHHIFVGDLSQDVDAKVLRDTFSKFGEVSETKIIRDPQTQKSRGYGFVSFPDRNEAEKAIDAMNGEHLGKRAIRTNWAARKPSEETRDKLTFEQVFNSTKPENTSVYVGNVGNNISDNDLRKAFEEFGTISEVRSFKSQGYAFVRFEKKEHATKAIMEMNQKIINGTPIRCSWGRTQQQTHTIAPLLPDFSNLLAAQQLLPQYTTVPQLNGQAAAAFWNPLAAAAAAYQPQFIAPQYLGQPQLNPAVPQW